MKIPEANRVDDALSKMDLIIKRSTMNYIIKPMQTIDERAGKGYVHYKSWQETYVGLIDAEYLQKMTEAKCKAIAHKWTDNIFVAKDGDKVIEFVGYGEYRDDTLSDCGEV